MTGLDLLGPDQRGLFIGGAWREADSGATLRRPIDPADGSVHHRRRRRRVADAVDALDAAVAAQADWAYDARRASAARSCAAPSS